MLDQKSFKMQLGTGATVSIFPKALYDQHFSQWPLHSTKIKLQAYNGVRIPVHGEVHLRVVYEQQELVLPLIVVHGNGSPLLCRNWFKQLKLNWHSIFHVSKADTLSNLSNTRPIVRPRLRTHALTF